jgi:hypothetical protein
LMFLSSKFARNKKGPLTHSELILPKNGNDYGGFGIIRNLFFTKHLLFGLSSLNTHHKTFLF